MRIAITGASGNVGRELVPRLLERGMNILLVGRDADALRRMFSSIPVTTYEEMANVATGCDVLVHLAVANTDSDLSPDAVRRINVEWTLHIARMAAQAGIPIFLNVSSVHALDDANQSAYAMSKREVAARLGEVGGIAIFTAYLAALYGNRYPGKVAVLNRAPKPLARLLFQFLAALKPTVHVSRLADHIATVVSGGADRVAILTDEQDHNPIYVGLKRILDLAFALTVFLFLNWLLFIIWVLVRVDSPGPGLFVQERIGRDGRIFRCYKFRSMRVDTKAAATHEIPADAVTSIGRFMRWTKLDELPQAWNILRNDMSIVGPRPCLPSQLELVHLRARKGVLSVKPGITGIAQVNGIDMRDPKSLVEFDDIYVKLRSILLDIKLIIATAFGRGWGDRIKGH